MLTAALISKALNNLETLGKVYVAYSGGIDSHVLLQLCASLPELTAQLTAVYVHHGLQAAADAWAQHCEQVSKQLGVDFICLRVNAQAVAGVSPEEAARDARYQALSTLLSSDDVVLLAQHQDDQLETVLLQLFRGAGLAGLAGMPVIAPLGKGRLLRPLLTISKQDILSYAAQQQLNWVEDPTNQSNTFDRNLLRNEILPILTHRWPMLAKTVARSARHCAEAQAVLDMQTKQALTTVADVHDQTIVLSKLSRLPNYQQRLVVRHWLHAQGLKMPTEALLTALFEQVILASKNRDPELIYQQISIRRYRDRLYSVPLTTLKKTLPNQPVLWPINQIDLAIDTGIQLRRVAAKDGINLEQWQAATVTVGFRQGGEKIALNGRERRHSLKNLCQEAAIPPWQRAALPLVYFDGQLAAVADRWICREVWTDNPTKAVRLVWTVR